MQPLETTLLIAPRARLDIIDLAQRVGREWGDWLVGYRRILYCSYHTTAGFLDQQVSRRLGHREDLVLPFLQTFQKLFPPDKDYRHDELDHRSELSPAQRIREPRNADSHLTFIGAGLSNCVTYSATGTTPVYFVDLDGIHPAGSRTRRARVVAYSAEEMAYQGQLAIPVSRHPIDSVNLRDPATGVMEILKALLARHGVGKGRIDLCVPCREDHAGLTVNEYETLLMRYDLAEILRDPLRHLVRGLQLLQHPRALPGHARRYASYDLIRILNELLDVLRVSDSVLETILAAALSASRRGASSTSGAGSASSSPTRPPGRTARSSPGRTRAPSSSSGSAQPGKFGTWRCASSASGNRAQAPRVEVPPTLCELRNAMAHFGVSARSGWYVTVTKNCKDFQRSTPDLCAAVSPSQPHFALRAENRSFDDTRQRAPRRATPVHGLHHEAARTHTTASGVSSQRPSDVPRPYPAESVRVTARFVGAGINVTADGTRRVFLAGTGSRRRSRHPGSGCRGPAWSSGSLPPAATGCARPAAMDARTPNRCGDSGIATPSCSRRTRGA